MESNGILAAYIKQLQSVTPSSPASSSSSSSTTNGGAKPAAKKTTTPVANSTPSTTTTTTTAPAKPASNAPSSEDVKALNELEVQVTNQGMIVKNLKKEGKPFTEELAKLQELKTRRDALAAKMKSSQPKFDIEGLQNLIARRMIVVPAFEIHGGVGGLMDLGPPGIGAKDNIVEVWKKHFVLKENMLQVECTNITPYSVLEASGHVQRFNDLLVEEMTPEGGPTGEFHRADKLLEAHIESMLEKNPGMNASEADRLRKLANSADSLSSEEMDKTILELGIVGPMTGRKLSPSRAFNLMFATTIGPGGVAKAFLRPETAQGIFVNFKRLLEYNGGRMPFASAQIGTGFRNEIAPKGGLIRVREFTMAEIEHFVHPKKKQHARFSEVADVKLQLFTAKAQTTTFEMEFMTAREAVDKGAINNETLAYFMARSQEFFVKIGIDPRRLRFRQHLPTEMAHYASDCYDAEILLSSGWLECAGHADRACYDLTAHSTATKVDLVASEPLPTPRIEKITRFSINKKLIGASLKANAQKAIKKLEDAQREEIMKIETQLKEKGKCELEPGLEITREMASVLEEEKRIFDDRYAPSVIEPSFGIGRILYATLEHAYWIRPESLEAETAAAANSKQQKEEDGKRDLTVFVRNVLSFKPVVAPIKCGIIPFGASNPIGTARELEAKCHKLDLSVMVETTSASIGRKYSRMDEIGIPFVITVDDDTQTDGQVTLRERDSEEQVRLDKKLVVKIVKQLCSFGSLESSSDDNDEEEDDNKFTSWAKVRSAFPIVRPAGAGRPDAF